MAKKILVVDDEPLVVKGIGMSLESVGYEVCKAADGEEAIEKMKGEKPDLVIMDVLMPKLTGYETWKKMATDEGIATIPIIMMSQRKNMRHFFDGLSIVEFFPKPFDAKMLLDKVEAVLGPAF